MNRVRKPAHQECHPKSDSQGGRWRGQLAPVYLPLPLLSPTGLTTQEAQAVVLLVGATLTSFHGRDQVEKGGWWI